MNKTTWKQHWHNIRASRTPRKYGVSEVLNLWTILNPPGEVAYGYRRGCMSIMQQPVTQHQMCPQCGIIRPKNQRYIWVSEHGVNVHTCIHCHPNYIPCPTCGGRCSTHELELNEGFCEPCFYEREDQGE